MTIPILGAIELAVFKAFFNRTSDWADIEAMVDAGHARPACRHRLDRRSARPDDERVARLRTLLDRAHRRRRTPLRRRSPRDGYRAAVARRRRRGRARDRRPRRRGSRARARCCSRSGARPSSTSSTTTSRSPSRSCAPMGGRPVLMQRFPHGAGGNSFFQKRVPENAPEWLRTTIVSTPNGTTSHALVVDDLAHVAWAVNLGCLGFHVWPSLADDPEHADELRIDLDPQPGVAFDEVARRGARREGAARRARHRSAARRRPATAASTCTCACSPQWDSVRGARGGGRAGARAGAPASETHHRRVVEGGARRARLHRLQPERAAQDRVRRVVRAGACPARRCRRRSPGTSSTRSSPTS